MRILLTGAAGQVGREIEQQALSRGTPILAMTRQDLDITDAAVVEKKVLEWQPDVIINGAAYTAVDQAEDDPETAFRVNRNGAANLADAAVKRQIPLIHLSTDYVFDGAKSAPYTESEATAPIGVYGHSKWQGEEAVRTKLDQHLIIRVSWVFGFYGHNFVKTILKLAKERDELRVVADQTGGPTCASHIADLLLNLCLKIDGSPDIAWGTYHFCGAPPTSWHAFAENIIEAGRERGIVDHPVTIHPISTQDYPTRARRPANSILDCSRLKEVFGIDQPYWKSGLNEMIHRIAEEY